MNLPRFIFVAFLLFVAFRPENGLAQIYADVTVSGGVSGTFTITLEDTKAPITVANFIGLATGQKGWLDLVTGGIRYDPFYNGVTFHRVIAGFMSQTGSRNGNGTDGPGYTFRDEIDPTLSHQPYTVSMANSGPNSNGSQWFVTQGTPSHLDGVHTVFGSVSDAGSQAVCAAINAVATDVSDRPLTPVTISSITVRGPSLAGFNVNSSSLPKVLNGGPVMKVEGANHALGFDHESYSIYYAFHSETLTSWTAFISSQYFHTSPPAAGDIDVTGLATGSKHFYRLARVDYSSCNTDTAPAPVSIGGKTMTFPGLFGTNYVTLIFNAGGTAGTYQYLFEGGAVQSGAITSVFYDKNGTPYSPSLVVNWDMGAAITFNILNFSQATAGKFTGQSNLNGFSYISGSFSSFP